LIAQIEIAREHFFQATFAARWSQLNEPYTNALSTGIASGSGS
jgi:hypothetical protein